MYVQHILRYVAGTWQATNVISLVGIAQLHFWSNSAIPFSDSLDFTKFGFSFDDNKTKRRFLMMQPAIPDILSQLLNPTLEI